ncbi:MAG: signal peptidase I [Christensenellales bacterium]|nr:signal peptidase I [Clostridiales bacterium]MDY5725894.1 signal peptidase I [Eubacteriales bacterium]
MNQKAKKITKIVVNVLLWIFLILSLLMTILAFSAQASNAGYPKLGKTCLLTVLSDSMNGPDGFKKGDLIICRALDDDEKKDLQVGDVVSFYADLVGDGNKALNTHRIIERNVDEGGNVTYVTQGDNREVSFVPDSPIGVDQIEAIWTGKRIGGLGSVIQFLQSSTGFLVCIVLPLAAFFIYELVVMIMTINKMRNKDKKQITQEEEEMIKQRAIEEYLAKQSAQSAEKQDGQDGSEGDN